MKIALCQINTTVADFEGNVRKIVDRSKEATAQGADLSLFPELAVPGYPPKDLYLRSDFISASDKALKDLQRRVAGTVLVGTIQANTSGVGKPLVNVAVLIGGGQVKAVSRKMLMPAYDVFDEARYFEPGRAPLAVRVGKTRIGISICEDVWNDRDFWPKQLYRVDPVQMLAQRGFDALVNISASPFELGKMDLRRRMLATIARKHGRPVLQVNLVGGNDELLFDGNSQALDAKGRIVARGRAFLEDLVVVDLDALRPLAVDRPSRAQEAYEALVMGTRDYAAKTGFRSAVLGLSGGIDSSVTACIAAAALGPKNVLGVLMPGPFSSKGSVRDAEALGSALGIATETIPIVPMVQAGLNTLTPAFHGRKPDVTEENLQARIRGMMLMALSNKFGHLLLTTGNKSELSVGYCTLYGDMCGGLAVISDAPKMLVYDIGRHINRRARVIPEAVFTKAPSAELRPNQTDQDSLPPYPALDAFIDAYVEKQTPLSRIRVRGMTTKDIETWAKKVDAAEYKRRQAPPGLKLTARAFGVGRREPIARKI